jgi:non-specific serine/threonine protein kinase
VSGDPAPRFARPLLPLQRTELVGRLDDLDGVLSLLSVPTTRMVTLTGLAGIGKTRLAVEVARRVAETDLRRVVFVELAPIDQAADILPRVAATFGLAGPQGADAGAELVRSLANDPTLLVLDNVEHLDTAPTIDRLLVAVEHLVVLATSRVPVGVACEHVWRLASLPVPTEDVRPDDVVEPAVELFRAVAATVDPRFTLHPGNADDVAAICRTLGGHPLSIELAAARSATLGPALLRGELARPGAGATLLRANRGPGRYRDLPDALVWSYERLDDDARRLLRRMSVFRGWVGLDDVAAVCGGAPGSPAELGRSAPTASGIIEALSQLVDDHLVDPVHEGRDTRCRMPAPIREAAHLWLSHDPGDAERTALAHTAHYRRLALDAVARADERDAPMWLRRITGAEDELRAALDRVMADGDAHAAADIGSALAWVWTRSGSFPAQRETLDRVREMVTTTSVPPLVRATFLSWAAVFAADVGTELAAVREVVREVRRALAQHDDAPHDPASLAVELRLVRLELLSGDLLLAEAHADMVIARLRDDEPWMPRFLSVAAIARDQQDRARRAFDLGARALAGARRHGDRRTEVRAGLVVLANSTELRRSGRLTDAEVAGSGVEIPAVDELLRIADALDDAEVSEWVRPVRAYLALVQGRVPDAAAEFGRMLRDATRVRATAPSTLAAMSLAAIAAPQAPHVTARIHGALGRRLEVGRFRLNASGRQLYDRAVEAARGALGDDAFDAARAAGATLSWPDALHEMAALAEAIGATANPPQRRRRATSQPTAVGGLTERECAVVTLLARGLTNKEISRELYMSPKTVMHHTSSIYRKLGVRGRTEATARAHLLGLTTPDHGPAGPSSRR